MCHLKLSFYSDLFQILPLNCQILRKENKFSLYFCLLPPAGLFWSHTAAQTSAVKPSTPVFIFPFSLVME